MNEIKPKNNFKYKNEIKYMQIDDNNPDNNETAKILTKFPKYLFWQEPIVNFTIRKYSITKKKRKTNVREIVSVITP